MTRAPPLFALFGAIGCYTLAAQTFLLREYLVSIQANELGIAIFFGTWLLWVAIGAALGTAVDRRLDVARWFAPLALAYPLLLLCQLVAIISLRRIAGVDTTALFPLGPLLWASVVVNAPTSLLTGFLFQSGCVVAWGDRGRDTAGSGRMIARLYAAEAAGSFVGGVAMTGLLWALVPPLSVMGGASLLLAGSVVWVARAGGRRGVAWLAASLCGALLATALTPLHGTLRSALVDLRWGVTMPGAELLETVETPYQTVSVAALPGQTVVLAGGGVATSTADRQAHATTAALLMSECPHARRVLVVGQASEGLVPALLRYPLERVELVSVDRLMHETILPHLGPDVAAAFGDSRVSRHVVDPRALLAGRDHTTDAAWDLVLIDLPDPRTAYLNRFYTRDFLESVHSALAPRGVVAARISAGENYAGTELAQYGRSVYRTLRAVFPEVVVTPGEQAWLFASTSPGDLTLDADELSRRFLALTSRDGDVPPDVFASLIAAERVESTRALFESTGGLSEDALLNTDRRPVTLFLGLLVAATQGGARFGPLLRAVRAVGLPVFLVPLLVFVATRLAWRATTVTQRPQSVFDGSVLLAVFGSAAVCVEIALLVAFQNRFGHLFVSVGLLAALFMLGLALGAAGGAAMLRRMDHTSHGAAHLVGALGVAMCLALPVAIDGLIHAPDATAMAAYHALLLLTGAVCGTAFPCASHYVEIGGHRAGQIAGLLESVDHWGGALGAAIVGTAVIPILGISATCSLLATAIGCAWALFAADPLVERAQDRLAGSRRRSARGGGWRAGCFAGAGIVVAAGLVSNLVAGKMDTPRVHLDERWIAARYETPVVDERDTPFVHYRVSAIGADAGSFEHTLVASRAVAPDVRGYGGPINLLVTTGTAGDIEGVSLLESRETPTYIHGAGDWLEGFVGWPLDRAVRLGDGPDEVDVMTGATISSRAMVDIVDRTRVALAREVYGHEVADADAGGWRDSLSGWVVAVVLLLLLSVPVFLWGGARARDAIMLANLLVAGAALNLQLSFADVARLLADGLPSSHAFERLVLIVGVLVLSVCFGQIYCGLVCPFGAVQELFSRVGDRLGLLRAASEGADRRARRIKVCVLIAGLCAFFVARSERVFAPDPLQAVFGGDWTKPMIVLLAVVGLASLWFFRFWCRYLCPVGAFFSLFNGLGVALRWARPKRPKACDLGVRSRWDMDCLQCNRCLDAARAQPAKPWLAARSGPRWRRDLGLALAIALASALVLSIARGEHVDATDQSPLGDARDVDTAEIVRQIGEHRLSDQEALYYLPIEEVEEQPETSAGESPLR